MKFHTNYFKSFKTSVAVAEVLCAQDIDQVGLFLRNLNENLSWLDLPVKSGQVAL